MIIVVGIMSALSLVFGGLALYLGYRGRKKEAIACIVGCLLLGEITYWTWDKPHVEAAARLQSADVIR